MSSEPKFSSNCSNNNTNNNTANSKENYCARVKLGYVTVPPNLTVKYDITNFNDPTESFIRADRAGPNPNPELCYLQKTGLCALYK